MKTGRFLTVVVLAAALFSVGLFSGDAQAEVASYLGDICWTFQMTDLTSGILELGIQDMGGGGHFLISGLFTTFGGTPIDSIITGNAEVFNNGIFMTLTRSRLDGNGMTSSVIHVALDSNLNGTIDERVNFIDSTVDDTGFRQGNIFLGCN